MEPDDQKRPFTVIAISGFAGAGKDTFAAAIERHLPYDTKTETIKMADALKEAINMALAYVGIDPIAYTEERAKKEMLRPVMVEFGRYCRSVKPAVFAQIAAGVLSGSYRRKCRVAFVTDMRYLNEYDILSEECSKNGWSFVPFHIECPGKGPVNDEEAGSIKTLTGSRNYPTACIGLGDIATFEQAGRDVAAMILQ